MPGCATRHRSAVVRSAAKRDAGIADDELASTAEAGEVALAGKGFNAEVEKEFREDSELNYEAVDQIQAYGISDREKITFLEDGELSGVRGLK